MTSKTRQSRRITVTGAGIAGLWAALVLARRGHTVRLIEAAEQPFERAASRLAGAMLAPYCEAEAAEPLIQELGIAALALWRATCPQAHFMGSLVVAQPRDRPELVRFARLTTGHETVDAQQIAALEPDLAQRYASGLYYPAEGHLAPAEILADLLQQARAAGCAVHLGTPWPGGHGSSAHEDFVIDCRGMAARAGLPTLRGVRGERIVLRTREVTLRRPVRLLHPRFPLYVVPWGDGQILVGATVIESEDTGPVTARSALDLLGAAYALHPAFGEAEIVELGSGLRPAFPDNVPRIVVDGTCLHINGLYRHGFLLSPALAELAADYIETGTAEHPMLVRA